MGALESMLASWRQHPDAELTISLCSYLRASSSDVLVSEVGFKAESVHGSDVDVLVAVARMYLGAGRLSDALRVFIAARSADGTDARPYRYLTEVLLRQGEASRAHAIAMKAIERGIGGAELETWLDRARIYSEIERKQGSRAVAARVAAELGRASIDSAPRRPLPLESAAEVDSAELLSVPDAEPEELEPDAMLSIPDGTDRLPSFELASDVAVSIPDGDVTFEESSDDDLTNVLGKDQFSSLQSFDDEATHVLDDEHTRELLEQSRRSSPPPPRAVFGDPFASDDDERTVVASARDVRAVGAPLPRLPSPPAGKQPPSGLAAAAQRVPSGPPSPRVPRRVPSVPPPAPRMPSSLPPPRPRHESAVITSRPPRAELPSFDVSEDLPPPPLSSTSPRPSRRPLAPLPVRAISPAVSASGSRTPPPPTPSRPPTSVPFPKTGVRTLPPPPISLGSRPPAAPVASRPPAPVAARPAPAAPKPASPVQYAPPTQSSPRAAVPADEDSIIVTGHGPPMSPSQRPPTPTVPPARPSGGFAARAETIRLSRPPVSPRSSGTWFYGAALLALLVGLVGGGAFVYVRNEADRRELARENEGLQRVMHWLRAGKPSDLAQVRSELEGQKRPLLEGHAVLLALRERTLRFIVTGDRPTDLAETIQRARADGVANGALAAARIASNLAHGDLAGALSAVKQGASVGVGDPYFRLLAGFTYEELGDARALGEYSAAHDLDPGLAVAGVLYARLLVLVKGAVVSHPDVDRIASALGDRTQGDALRALADVLREPGAPASDAPSVEGAALARLPAPLQCLGGLQSARKAVSAGDADAARAAARNAAATTASPFLLTRIAAVALAARDVELPISIASRLEQIDSDDPAASLLRARVALLKGDIAGAGRLADRVQKVDVARVDAAALAVVRGIIAYERQDRVALDALVAGAADERVRSELAALRVGAELMQGHVPSGDGIDALAREAAPWADLVAVDAALDVGRMDHANHLMAGWTDVLERPLHLIRTARLARYTGKLPEATSSARQAIDAGARSFDAVTENVYALLARGSVQPAEKAVTDAAAFDAHVVLWLKVLVRGIMGRALLAGVELPGRGDALHLRILAAYAMARARDSRLKAYVTELQAAAPAQPDIVALSQSAH